jgi:hypothetical protein
MKTKDITIGAEYAVGHKGSPRRATVLAVGQTRRVYSRESIWNRHGREVTDGIKVRYAEPNYKGEIHEAVVAPSEVRRAWIDQAARDSVRKGEEAAAQARIKRMQDLAAQLTAAGFKARVGWGLSYHGASRGRHFLEIEDLDAIERLLYPGEGLERFTWKDGDIEIQKEGAE